MSLMENPIVMMHLARCTDNFNAQCDDKVILERDYAIVNDIHSWRFSKDEYCFHPIPYRSEVMAFNPGRIVATKYATVQDAMMKGFHCAGYIGDKLSVILNPSKSADGWTMSYFGYDETTITIRNATYFLGNRKVYPRLEGMTEIIWLEQNAVRLMIVVGRQKQYTLSLLHYGDDGLLNSETAFSRDWPQEEYYRFHHNEHGEMIRITVDSPLKTDDVLWQAKNKPS
jgi:hypothetical protein